MKRMTKQRQAVFEELQRVSDFRSAQQIFDDLQRQGHKVGLATVYRNLQALAESEDIDSVRSNDGETLYRLCMTEKHHHHLVCRLCGSTREIEQADIEAWVNRIASQFAFSSVDHHMELFGVCSTCSVKSGATVQTHSHSGETA